MQAGEQGNHGLVLTNRSHAEISGVTDVDCFNEQVVVLSTTLGTMTISGSGLNISHLNQEEGRLVERAEDHRTACAEEQVAGERQPEARLDQPPQPQRQGVPQADQHPCGHHPQEQQALVNRGKQHL